VEKILDPKSPNKNPKQNPNNFLLSPVAKLLLHSVYPKIIPQYMRRCYKIP
jgi:hypothetical protein